MSTATREQAREQLVPQWPLPAHPAVRDELLARWSETHRRYHDVVHLAELLAALKTLGTPSRAVVLAAWFHDAVYDGVPEQDERRSAELAHERLTALELPTDEVAEVVRLVLLTLAHAPMPGDWAGAQLSDADLAILGASPPRYAASVADIRREYGHLTDADWRAGRAAVLESFLAQVPLFRTVAGRQRWEEQARANVTAELAALRGDGRRLSPP